MANRLREVLPVLIDDSQNAFLKGRLVSDNLLLAHELIEFVRHRTKGKKMFFGLKLDMNKTYDRVDWNFLIAILRLMGFTEKWIQLIHQCVSTVSFSVLLNGQPSDYFTPKAGLRQGDPLSPYLFIIVMQALSEGLAHFAHQGICKGIAISRHSPPISHLLFADDCFLFMHFKSEEVWFLQWLLNDFCQQMGLRINVNKSELYLSPNFCSRERLLLESIFHFKVVLHPGVYLGASMDWSGKSKTSLFRALVDKVARKLQGWKCGLLNFAGRCIMVKHVLQAIPLYLMSVFKVPCAVTYKLTAIIRRFLWKSDKNYGLCWKKWDSLCVAKLEGGLGFRDLGCFNQALLAKQAWRLISNLTSLFAKVLLGKYCSAEDLFHVRQTTTASWGWKSLLWGRELLKTGLLWRVGNGQLINPFVDLWIPGQDNPVEEFGLNQYLPSMRVNHWIDSSNLCWRRNLLRWLFPENVVQSILGIHIPLISCPDKLVWRLSRNGIYSVKSGYWAAIRRKFDRVNGNNVINPSIWKKLWKTKIPLRWILFIWRCLHNILLVQWQLKRRGLQVDPICAR
ncbi:unnamed protein product [Camellia sinensis]